MTDRPDYIDRDGDLWTYGPDVEGNTGYHVADGIAFPFKSEVDDDYGWVTFEDVVEMHGLVEVGTQYALLVHEREADGANWIEGPFGESAAMNRRNDLFDSRPGFYSVAMYEYRRSVDNQADAR